MQKILLFLSFLIIKTTLFAQVISCTPAFPNADSDITITFDASQGNGALKDITQTIYAHTGVITDKSSSLTDWKYVKTSWNVQDANTQLKSIGNNKYTLTFNIRKYYGVPATETVRKMAFVFRTYSSSGNPTVGRAADGSDIYYDVYDANAPLQSILETPTSGAALIKKIGESIEVVGITSKNANLILRDNGSNLFEDKGTILKYNINITKTGTHNIDFIADDGTTSLTKSFSYTVVNTDPVSAPMPSGTQLGANYISNTSLVLRLFAPKKANVFLIGDFNNWQISPEYALKKDGDNWWIQMDNLGVGKNYRYQYLVDGVKIADPLSELILDPANDGGIDAKTYPNMLAYPLGLTTGFVSVIQMGQNSYNWKSTSYKRPEKTKLVIYELLMRDFMAQHNYQGLIDTLNYFQRLGVNAIELMPIQEFENNQSWGYNPSFHNALDKYYGTADKFKELVDECHKRNIAVIIDVVFNHAFGQSPLNRLYWDAANNRPSADNPWLNPTAKHPYNVGYDFNHESQATKEYVERCLKFWLKTYNIDGYRFDLSKGFTQNTTMESNFGNYDASRIAILKGYADAVWKENANAYVILEHFADQSEESVLADYGMLLWGNMNFNYNEGTMGWEVTKHNLDGGIYKSRGMKNPNLITYMESHDEERLMYKNLQFGNANASYSIKNLSTALKRQELASVFFYTIPGPKMLWQFGEMGYDYSINTCTNGTVGDCRLDNKPIRWDYLQQTDRKALFEVTRQLIHLKKTYPVFETTNFSTQIGANYTKSITLNGSDRNVYIVGNFNVTDDRINMTLPTNVNLYEFFTGDSLKVSNANHTFSLKAGEYRLYSTKKLQKASNNLSTATQELNPDYFGLKIYPNPSFSGEFTLGYSLQNKGKVEIQIYNSIGQLIKNIKKENEFLQNNQLTINDLEKGIYFVKIQNERWFSVKKVVVH